MTPKQATLKCPGCDMRLPEDDYEGQKQHMEERHPEIIDERRKAAGFRQIDGQWVDVLSGPD